jgi:hypothetical protein
MISIKPFKSGLAQQVPSLLDGSLIGKDWKEMCLNLCMRGVKRSISGTIGIWIVWQNGGTSGLFRQ